MREYLSLRELADYSGICVRTLRDHLKSPTHPLPSYRFGRSIRVRRADFDQWAEQFRCNSVSQDVEAIVAEFT